MRVDTATATMTMGQPFAGVWLPESLTVEGALTLATGTYRAEYARRFSDYRQGDVQMRFRVKDEPSDRDARCVVVRFVLCAWLSVVGSVHAQASLVIEDVRVHGNHSTPDEEVLRIAAIAVGVPLEPGAVEAARRRLVDSGRFSSVEIRQRSRSIEDPTRIALIILVAEHAAMRPIPDVDVPPIPGVLGRLRSQTMFLPILSVDDGYGLTYGLRTSFVGGRGSTTRLSVPASWGGTRQLAVEAETDVHDASARRRRPGRGHRRHAAGLRARDSSVVD